MKTRPSGSVAAAVRQRVLITPAGTFLRRKDFPGSDRAVESELSRLVKAGELVRVRRGLYWRGKKTRFGMTRPSVLEVGIAVAGKGAGPAGVAAAHVLGLTTQVPATVDVAAPGKAPEPLPGARFRSRPYARRERDLRPMEVAVLEILREPAVVELPWDAVQQRISELTADKKVRPAVITAEVLDEHHPAARTRWTTLAAAR